MRAKTVLTAKLVLYIHRYLHGVLAHLRRRFGMGTLSAVISDQLQSVEIPVVIYSVPNHPPRMLWRTCARNTNVEPPPRPIQEAQQMLTNPRDAFRGQSRSPNIVSFHMLGIVSY